MRPVVKQRNRKNKLTSKQLRILIDFMSIHEDLAIGRLSNCNTLSTYNKKWRIIAARLNLYGPSKKVEHWKECWRNLKDEVILKLNSTQSQESDMVLSSNEIKIINILQARSNPFYEDSKEVPVGISGSSKDMDTNESPLDRNMTVDKKSSVNMLTALKDDCRQLIECQERLNQSLQTVTSQFEILSQTSTRMVELLNSVVIKLTQNADSDQCN